MLLSFQTSKVTPESKSPENSPSEYTSSQINQNSSKYSLKPAFQNQKKIKDLKFENTMKIKEKKEEDISQSDD